MNKRWLGILNAALAAAFYGLNPLFALPLYHLGFSVEEAVFCRYFFGVLMMAAVMLFYGKSLFLPRKYLFLMIIAGFFMSGSSLTLFQSYKEMDVGIAATILFVYPIMVAAIMVVGYREKITISTVASILAALLGGGVLSCSGGGKVTLFGVFIVLMSSLTYAIYLVEVKVSRLKELTFETLTFYTLVFGLVLTAACTNPVSALSRLTTFTGWTCVILGAFFPTVLSLFTTALAIRYVGPTTTAVLGALEPTTSVLIGVVIFGEIFTLSLGIGLVLIVTAVVLIVMNPPNSGS